jgi:hypothetical protein
VPHKLESKWKYMQRQEDLRANTYIAQDIPFTEQFAIANAMMPLIVQNSSVVSSCSNVAHIYTPLQILHTVHFSKQSVENRKPVKIPVNFTYHTYKVFRGPQKWKENANYVEQSQWHSILTICHTCNKFQLSQFKA